MPLTARPTRERAYIAALADFYHPGATEYPARIAAYSAAMGKLLRAAIRAMWMRAAFYALSLLAAEAPDDTSLAAGTQGDGGAHAAVRRSIPINPGVVHYIIHACDNPAMAADGLGRRQTTTARSRQSGPHAFHMPGHIYARLGLWPQDIDVAAWLDHRLAGAEAHGESGIMDEPHSYDFVLYAYLQSGQDAHAKAVARAALSDC